MPPQLQNMVAQSIVLHLGTNCTQVRFLEYVVQIPIQISKLPIQAESAL